ncbi:MAG: DUF3016 domain-containing protein [Burkholderiaceae bacterium]
MDTIRRLLRLRRLARTLGALLIGAVAAVSAAPGETVSTERAEVSRRIPGGFTEMQRSPHERREWLDELGRHVAKRAAHIVPKGQRLLVTITDVQRAGMVEPWRPGRLADVRIVRDPTPPRIDLSFQLVSAQGAVLKEGSRRLRDLAFLNRGGLPSSDPLRYEKSLIDTWLRDDFGPVRR